MVSAGLTTKSADGLTQKQQLNRILPAIADLTFDQQKTFQEIKEELTGKNILILKFKELFDDEKSWLGQFFRDEIFPVLTPLAVDPAHPFPFLPSQSITMVCALKNKMNKLSYSLVIFPPKLERFFKISKPTLTSSSGSSDSDILIVSPIPLKSKFPTPIEDLIEPVLFPPASVIPKCNG